MTVPQRLVEFGEAIDAAIQETDYGWVASLDLVGCWPIPDRSLTFGKGSSCVIGSSLLVSCAEVELALRARRAGWEGGWISTFNPDSRFPTAWRPALVSKAEAIQMLRTEFPRSGPETAGIPDLVFAKGGLVVAAECKRLRGRYRNNKCEWRPGGDSFKPSQDAWAAAAMANGVSRGALVTIWWNRIDSSDCDQRAL